VRVGQLSPENSLESEGGIISMRNNYASMDRIVLPPLLQNVPVSSAQGDPFTVRRPQKEQSFSEHTYAEKKH
jgi:hypothetical protein